MFIPGFHILISIDEIMVAFYNFILKFIVNVYPCDKYRNKKTFVKYTPVGSPIHFANFIQFNNYKM